jgi:hypothetical protein
MCRLVTCKKCKRPTYAGCGAHIEQVLGHVPQDQRCACRDQPGATGGGFRKALRSLFGR